jgi:hypothetical protein
MPDTARGCRLAWSALWALVTKHGCVRGVSGCAEQSTIRCKLPKLCRSSPDVETYAGKAGVARASGRSLFRQRCDHARARVVVHTGFRDRDAVMSVLTRKRSAHDLLADLRATVARRASTRKADRVAGGACSCGRTAYAGARRRRHGRRLRLASACSDIKARRRTRRDRAGLRTATQHDTQQRK